LETAKPTANQITRGVPGAKEEGRIPKESASEEDIWKRYFKSSQEKDD